MSDATSLSAVAPSITVANLDRFARVDVLGLEVEAQQVWPNRAVLFCKPTWPDDICPGCGGRGGWHDSFIRWFTHLPVGRAATKLQVRAPRYRCRNCGKVWRHGLRTVAKPRSKLTRTAVLWALQQVVLDHAAISAVAGVLQLGWGTVHDAVNELGQEVLIDHPERFDGVRVVGVDEHCWRHTRHGDKSAGPQLTYFAAFCNVAHLLNFPGPSSTFFMTNPFHGLETRSVEEHHQQCQLSLPRNR